MDCRERHRMVGATESRRVLVVLLSTQGRVGQCAAFSADLCYFVATELEALLPSISLIEMHSPCL